MSILKKTVSFFDETEWLNIVAEQNPEMLYASHKRKSGRYFTPWLDPKDLVKKNIFKRLHKFAMTPAEIPPVNAAVDSVLSTNYTLEGKGTNCISFLGHSSFVIKLDGSIIFADPFFSSNASIVRKKVKMKLDYSSIPSAPIVLITHNHYDHMDKQSIIGLIKKGATFIVPLGLKSYISKLGASTVHEMDWWEELVVSGIKYTFLPSQHWSYRLGQPINSTLWGSFLIEGGKTIFFSGDSGYFVGYKEFGKRFPNIDYALLPVGAYNPRWQRYYQHQNIEEMFISMDDMNAKYAIPMHYGAIRLGKESIDYPMYKIASIMEEQPKYKDRVKLLKVGETLEIVI